MKSRGLTMIETLLAIALLTLVVSAAATWTAMAGRLATAAAKPAQEQAAVDAVFRLIQNDLVTGDFDVERRTGSEAHPLVPRVRAVDGVLELRTRAGAVHRYQFDRNDRVLRRESSQSGVRTLLRDVTDMRLSIDEIAGVLDVAIDIQMKSEHVDGGQKSTQTYAWRFNLP